VARTGALFKPRRLITLALAFGLPLLLYGYVFWRGESDVGVEFHMKDFSDMVLGAMRARGGVSVRPNGSSVA